MSDGLCDLQASELLALMGRGEVSCTEVMTAHLDRIESVNPGLNAIVTIDRENALEASSRADVDRRSGAKLGALHALPVGIKDLVETAGMRTTYGSPIFRDHVPAHDASIVRRFKEAGAIIVGKTNTPEFGAGSHTFNPVFGTTRNPWDRTRCAGGSSGGAAVALATGMLALADGSDLGGSLRNPASFCNVVGLRPSPGVVSNLPTADAWDPLAVSGPMARTVDDVALALDAIAGPDPLSPLSDAGPAEHYAQDITRDVSGLRIAWSRDLGGLPFEPEVLRALAPARSTFENLGCEVSDAEPDLTDADEVFDVLRALGFVAGHHQKLLRHRSLLKDTVIWNIEAGLKLTPLRIARAMSLRSEIFQRMVTFLDGYDALALPVSQVAPFPVENEWAQEIDGVPMEHYVAWQRSCSRITVTGHPAISVPAAFTSNGLPVGLQLVGHFRGERALLRVARAFEIAAKATASRRPRHV